MCLHFAHERQPGAASKVIFGNNVAPLIIQKEPLHICGTHCEVPLSKVLCYIEDQSVQFILLHTSWGEKWWKFEESLQWTGSSAEDHNFQEF